VLQSRRTRPFLGESLQKPVSDLRTAKDLRTEQAAPGTGYGLDSPGGSVRVGCCTRLFFRARPVPPRACL